MKGYRIMYSAQSRSYKIQVKFCFFFWLNITANGVLKEFESIDEAKKYMANALEQKDWKEVSL